MMSLLVTLEPIQEPDGSAMDRSGKKKTSDGGSSAQGCGRSCALVAKSKAGAGDRRARARMVFAAPLPPSIYNPRFKHGEVGSSAPARSTIPQ